MISLETPPNLQTCMPIYLNFLHKKKKYDKDKISNNKRGKDDF